MFSDFKLRKTLVQMLRNSKVSLGIALVGHVYFSNVLEIINKTLQYRTIGIFYVLFSAWPLLCITYCFFSVYEL